MQNNLSTAHMHLILAALLDRRGHHEPYAPAPILDNGVCPVLGGGGVWLVGTTHPHLQHPDPGAAEFNLAASLPLVSPQCYCQWMW